VGLLGRHVTPSGNAAFRWWKLALVYDVLPGLEVHCKPFRFNGSSPVLPGTPIDGEMSATDFRAFDTMLIRSFIKTVLFCSLSLISMAAAAQQFKQPLVIPTGSWPAGIVSADLNGDGKADLIYTDYGATPTASTTHVLLNNGDGTFSPGQTIATAGAVIAAADFDHDGHVDLAWVWGAVGLGKAYLARGNGDGTFAAAQELGTFAIVGTNAPVFSYVMGAQLHDTGYLDLLVEDVANPSLITLTTDSSDTLIRIVGTKLESGTGPMVAADLNGDGHTDLVIQSVLGGAADVFLGSADGLLVAAGAYAGSSPVQSMLLHDVDGDGHLDLVVEGTNGRIEILHGNTDGSFAATSEGGSGSADGTTGTGGHLVAITDAGGQHNFYTSTPAGMSVLQEQSNLSLSLLGIYNAGPGRTSFAVADFNGDGVPDVAVDSPEGVAVLFGSADGLGNSRAFAAGMPALNGALGDFSGSGNLDEVVNVAATQALLLHGNGDGTFAALVTPTTLLAGASSEAVPVRNLPGVPQAPGMVQAAVVMVDLDGDGNTDVIIVYDNTSADHAHPTASVANAIYIWYGESDGTYAAPVMMTPSRNFYQLAAVDLNNDGRPDLVMSDGYVVSVQDNLGGRTFGTEEHSLAGMGINSISAGDVNKDGFTDLVIANGGVVLSNPLIYEKTTTTPPDVNTGGITVLLNTGLQAPIPTTTVLTITSPLTITFGQVVNGTAQVTASDGSVPTGTITFYDGAMSICAIPVAPSASCPASARTGFAVGTHVLTAAYSGDATHLPSTSAAVTVVVLPVAKATTVTMLTASVDPATSGQEVVFTANVLAAGGVAAPTGAVTFLDGSTVLGTKTLVGSGVASLSVSSLDVGSHSVTASYAGDANSVGSVSTVMTETVTGTGSVPSGFSISVSGGSTVEVGGTARLQVAVAAQAGYLQPVQLSCADLPSESACTFASRMVPAGGGTTTLQLSTMAPHSCEVTGSGSTTASLPFAGTTVAALLVLFIPGKRRRAIKSVLVALIALCGMATLSGCGNCTDLGTEPGTYTIRVIGTSGVNVVTTKVQVTVTVE
jgi:Bacterial Ig-like domain (group 3)/FG-GAP-like repeat/FG-GAP repeat